MRGSNREGGGFREEQERIEPRVTPWGEIRYELHKRCRRAAIVLFNIIWELLVVVFLAFMIL